MYPERDSRAEEFDDAVERQRLGNPASSGDQDLDELVRLAARLEHDLPAETPDPAFRDNLKFQLLSNTAMPGEPQEAESIDAASEPIDLDQERWHRRLIASPWRVGAAAAACFGFVVIAFVMMAEPFSSGTEDREERTAFQAVDADDVVRDDGLFGDQFPLDMGDNPPPSEQWFTASFPPFDGDHVVLPPMVFGFLPFAERYRPRVELSGATDMADQMSMPGNGSVYYLNAPPDGSTMLTTLSSMLGVDGDLVEGDGNGEPYRVVDSSGHEILRWDPSSAFFHFQGSLMDDPVDDLLDGDASASEIARRFLELIGFDFYTIEYNEVVIENETVTEVQFRPDDFPETALDVTLGGSVFVNADGAIMEAQLYWLSLVDIEVVRLRDPESIISDIQEDAGYSPPATDDVDEVWIDAVDIMVIHVLTRLGDSNFVLQPAVKVTGEYGTEIASAIPGPARYLVPAVDKGN
jgi:hypothetical protein